MSDTGTGPVPAPESTHTPGPVFRDRGVIIATLIADNERLKDARDGWMATLEEWEARAENAEARIAELELACQRLRDDTQGAHAERDQAKAEVRRLLEKLRRFRRKYGQPAPAVTPTETQAEDEWSGPCTCGAWESGHCDCRPAPVADPTTGETR